MKVAAPGGSALRGDDGRGRGRRCRATSSSRIRCAVDACDHSRGADPCQGRREAAAAARIFRPLRLRHTAYDPQGPITGAHANGYELAANGTLIDTTLRQGADGAIVTDAIDEATFLTSLTDRTLLGPSTLHELGAGERSGCGGPPVHVGSGAGDGFKSDVVYAVYGSHVAVLLLNVRAAGQAGFSRVAAAATRLYCAG